MEGQADVAGSMKLPVHTAITVVSTARNSRNLFGPVARPRKIRINGEKSVFVTRPMKSLASGPSQLTRRG
eukprot:scaffold135400_cov28-Attheya_sp.AAC.2